MPFFYVSMADSHSGEFLAAVIINAPDGLSAERHATGLAFAAHERIACIEAVHARIPAGSPPIPRDLYCRLLSVDELARIDTPVPVMSQDGMLVLPTKK